MTLDCPFIMAVDVVFVIEGVLLRKEIRVRTCLGILEFTAELLQSYQLIFKVSGAVCAGKVPVNTCGLSNIKFSSGRRVLENDFSRN